MINTPLPKLFTWMFVTGILFLIFMTIMRIYFFVHFSPPGYTFAENLDSFQLGLSYDLRIISGILVLPFLLGNIQLKYTSKKWLEPKSLLQVIITLAIMFKLISLMKIGESPFYILIYTMEVFFVFILIWIFIYKNCNPFANAATPKFYKIYLFLATTLLVFFYAIDFQHYDYLHQRLNASIWNYTADAAISLKMVWQSYPVIKIFILIIATIAIIYGIIIYTLKKLVLSTYRGSYFSKILISLAFALLLGLGMFGNLNIYPLKSDNALNWSDAFIFQDGFKANLALNPGQSFISTLQYGSSLYDINKVKSFYPLMASALNIDHPDSNDLNYVRTFSSVSHANNPNVVLVICESFSAYKSSMWGNKLNTTPYFNELSKNGIFFDRCFTPGYGTARGVWATVTGIPDVDYRGTSSQNPAYVNQQTIINDYVGYEKFYFMGGSSEWANLRGLFDNNIKGIKIYDNKNLNVNDINVWGISDKLLFLKSNEVFKKQSMPFFAIIQTTNNHRPYTIDKADLKEFKLETYPPDTLIKYGFQSNEELNAFRYSDYCFEKFIEAAKKETYFKNTIFVFVGDHGIPGVPPAMFPRAWELNWLCYNHVPLLFYAPALLSPQRISTTASQLDILPTVTALAGVSFTNSTLGRNLLDTITPDTKLHNPRFIFHADEKAMGIVTDQYIYMHNYVSGKDDFRSSKDDLPLSLNPEVEEARKEMKTLTEAYIETAKYMLTHNEKKAIAL